MGDVLSAVERECELIAETERLRGDVACLLEMNQALAEQLGAQGLEIERLTKPSPAEYIAHVDFSIARRALSSVIAAFNLSPHVDPLIADHMARFFAAHRHLAEQRVSTKLGPSYREAIGVLSDLRQAIVPFVDRMEQRLSDYAAGEPANEDKERNR